MNNKRTFKTVKEVLNSRKDRKQRHQQRQQSRIQSLRSRLFERVSPQYRMSKEEVEKMFSESGGLQVMREEAHEIERWSDFDFTAPDGRKFGLFLWGDTILHRLRAKSILINEADKDGIQQAESVSGMILEVGTKHPPLIFEDSELLGEKWIELHRTCDVPCTREEVETLEAMTDDLVIEDALRPLEMRRGPQSNPSH